MSTVTLTPLRTAHRTVSLGAALLVFSCAVLAIFDFFITTSNGSFTSTADYVYTLDGLPFVAGLLLVVSGLRTVQRGRDGKLGRAGFLVVAVGVAAVFVCLITSVVTSSENSLGPVYVLGTFATIIGLVIFAVASLRARVLPWWVGPALALTWIVGGPVGDNGPLGFPASGLLLAAVAIAIAVVTPRIPAAER